MADEIDAANEIADAYQSACLERALIRAAAPRARKKCEHCEENPADIAPNGVQLRYCGRCRDELTPPRIAPTSCATLPGGAPLMMQGALIPAPPSARRTWKLHAGKLVEVQAAA
jgi:hypothetical protein